MAKRKKKSSKKKAKPKKEARELPNNFWPQTFGILVIVLAVLSLIGALGTGGSLPEGLFDALRRIFGMAAYVVPIFIIMAVVGKMRSEENRIPRSTFWGSAAFLFTLSGFIHVFSDSEMSSQVASDGNGGGSTGHIVNSVLLGFLDTPVAGLVLAVAVIVSLHFVFKLPMTFLLQLVGILKKEKPEEEEKKEDAKAEKKKAKEEETSFKLNEGVPVQRRGLRSLKNSAQKLSEDESHEALTTAGDPEWNFPSVDLLNNKQDKADAGDVEGNASIISDTLSDFNIEVEMQGANVGPRVTQYTLKPPSGVKLTKITALENNLALNLAATSIRMEAPIPGKRAVGIEVPNEKSATVVLRSVLDSPAWKRTKSPLAFAIGKDIAGEAIIGELDKMPHLLIAGATGSGKSVMINAFLISLMYRNSPADLKLILVDPKQVELTPYNDIPHLLTPVIVDPEKTISALKWAVAEMERRYGALSEAGKRNIAEYNKLKKEEGMPYIVIVIDELADMMMVAARDVEALIVRLAQKARAVGIHLVLATQRPSVDVITGLIKANIPARVGFTVASQVDSRTILDAAGAEKLLGQGDMLYSIPSLSKPKRIQGVFINDKEINDVTDFIRMERAPEYDDEVVTQKVQLAGRGGVVVGGDSGPSDDSLYTEAVQVVIDSGKASASLLQRRLRVGYARAARLVESMEEQGVVGPADGARPREVLVSSMDEVLAGEPDEGA